MEYPVNKTINFFEQAFEQREIFFPEPLPVKVNQNFCLMFISSVSLDGTGKLFIKDHNGIETEVHDTLIYAEFILSAINKGLKNIFYDSTVF
jgi:hypothetical protein